MKTLTISFAIAIFAFFLVVPAEAGEKRTITVINNSDSFIWVNVKSGGSWSLSSYGIGPGEKKSFVMEIDAMRYWKNEKGDDNSAKRLNIPFSGSGKVTVD